MDAPQAAAGKGIPDWDGYHGHMIQILPEQNPFAVKAGGEHHTVLASLPPEKQKPSTGSPKQSPLVVLPTTKQRQHQERQQGRICPVYRINTDEQNSHGYTSNNFWTGYGPPPGTYPAAFPYPYGNGFFPPPYKNRPNFSPDRRAYGVCIF